MGMARDRELSTRSCAQDVAMTRRHRQTALGIETQR